MNGNDLRNLFVDSLLGRLSSAEEAEFQKALAESPDAAQAFAEYKKVFRTTQALAREEFRAPPALAVKVMEEVEQYPRLSSWRFYMGKASSKFAVVAPALATTAVVCLVLIASMTFLGQEASESFMKIGRRTNAEHDYAVAGGGYAGPSIRGELKSSVQETMRNVFPSLSSQDAQPAAGPQANSVDELTQGAGAADPTGYRIQPSKSKESQVKIFLDAVGKEGKHAGAPAALSGAPLRRSADSQISASEIPAESAMVELEEKDSVYYSKPQPPSQQSFPLADRERRHDVYAPARKAQERLSSSEVYGQYEENALVAAASQPLSTFSLDVDTGSYTNARRYLRNGQLPPPESVRVEEYINYFDYDYPKDAAQGPFTVNYEIAPSPLSPGKHLLKVGVRTNSQTANGEPWNLVFLIDVSGSMADSDKLPLLKEAFKTLAAHMRPNDRVAIVTYAGDAGLALDSTPGTRKEEILRAIDRLRAGGSTNGSGGIALAYQTAAKNRITGGVNRVILATDGDFNVGTTSFSGLLQIVEEMRGTGITLTTLGFGQGNYNERNLEQLANKGNGNYFYIDSVEEGREVLGAKLAANMEVAAKDVKVQLEFNPENVKAYRLIGYDNRRLQHQDFSNDAVDAGEVGAGHSVTVLYEVLLADGPADASLEEERRYRDGEARVAESRPAPKHIEELGFLKIRYKRPAEDISTPLEFPLYTSKIVQTIDSASRDFRFAAAVSCFGQVLRQSRYAESCTLADARELAAGALGDDLYGKRKEFVQIVDKAQAVKGARPDGYRY